jgi:hypothetical protein
MTQNIPGNIPHTTQAPKVWQKKQEAVQHEIRANKAACLKPLGSKVPRIIPETSKNFVGILMHFATYKIF